ncbi:MAG: hypothetical protein ACPGF7_12660 [Pontibacterium sp.]
MVLKRVLAGFLLCSLPVMAAELPADPTRPLSFKKSSKTVAVAKRHYSLSYLMTGKSRRVAVINGKMVQPGGQVDGARVLAITSEGVSLRVGNQPRTLLIGQTTGFKKEKRDRKHN